MKYEIYPINLPDHVAKKLVMSHAMSEFENASHRHYRNSRLGFSARLYADGNVALHVHYSFDDGFCMGSGGLLDKTIRPYNETELQAIKRKRILYIATQIHAQREEEKRRLEIEAIAHEVFKGEFE